MRLTQEQFNTLSDYFASISKILVGSAMIGFFLPTQAGPVTIPVFIIGSLMAVGFLILSIRLIK